RAFLRLAYVHSVAPGLDHDRVVIRIEFRATRQMIAGLVVCCLEQMGDAEREVTLSFVRIERETALSNRDGAIEPRRLDVPEPVVGFDDGKKAVCAGEFRIGCDGALKAFARQAVVVL